MTKGDHSLQSFNCHTVNEGLWSEICGSRTPNGTERSCRPERKLLSRRTTVAYKFTILYESSFQGIYFIIFMTYNFVPGNVPINYMLSLLSRPFVFPASPTIANKYLWKKKMFLPKWKLCLIKGRIHSSVQ